MWGGSFKWIEIIGMKAFDFDTVQEPGRETGWLLLTAGNLVG